MEKKYIVKLDDNKLAYTAIIIDGVPYIKPLQLLPYTEPDLEQVRKGAYDKGYENGFIAGHLKAEKSGQSFYEDGYQCGLNDAWGAARKICTNWVLSDSVLSEIFGMDKTIDDVMKENTASEVIEKIRAYEQKEEIQVGDEVVGTYTGGEETEPFVIIRKIPEIDPPYYPYYFGIYSKSGEFCQGGLKLKKTGRHFPEIAEVLQKMKETDNG